MLIAPPSSFRLVLYDPVWIFMEKRRLNLWQNGSASATVIYGGHLNNQSNSGNSTQQKKKSPIVGGGKEGEGGNHSKTRVNLDGESNS